MPEEITIKKRLNMIPKWIKHEDIQSLAQACYDSLDEKFPVHTATNGHHYLREKNLKPFIARWLIKAYKMGLKNQSNENS